MENYSQHQYSTSFRYSQIFSGNLLMVIVPHQDDEMNTAGSVIYGALLEGMRVILVYLTNGDYEFPFSVRQKEAYDMGQAMGIPEKDIIFLGFADNISRQMVENPMDNITSKWGQNKTYGNDIIADFSTLKNGVSKSYSLQNYKDAIEEVILHFHPDAIIATDYDKHVDHRLCSIIVEKVVASLVKRKLWNGKLYKGLAYATAYETVKDYFEKNLKSTKIKIDIAEDNPALEWNQRLRLPVPDACRTYNILENQIYKGMSKHVSQHAYSRSGQLINGDQVYWERRTDNLALHAKISVSSGNELYLNDILKYDSPLLLNDKYNRELYMWIPNVEDTHPMIRIDLEEACFIGECIITGVTLEESVTVQVETSSGQMYTIDSVTLKDSSIQISLDSSRKETYIIITFSSNSIMLSEIEIFNPNTVYSFCHILADEEFLYHWIVYPGESIPEIGVYISNLKIDSLEYAETNYKWQINSIEVPYKDVNEYIKNHLSNDIMEVKVINTLTGAFCTGTIKKGNFWDVLKLRGHQIVEKIRLMREGLYIKRKSRKIKGNALCKKRS